MSAVPAWKWFFAALLVAGSAFCSGTETALTALGDAKARQLRDRAGRRERMLSLWVDYPERVLSTLLIGNTLMSVGAGTLAAELGSDLSGLTGLSPAKALALCATAMTAAVLFLGEIVPKMLAKRYPERVALASIPVVRVMCFLLWPLSQGVTRLTSGLLGRLGAGEGSPAVTGEEIEYLIEMGTREGVLDEVKEELLNSVLEFADRVAKEIMVPRTRMVGISRDLPEAELIRVITENPYSRMPVFAGTMDEVVGILIVREIVGELRHGKPIELSLHLKPAFFVPEGMKVSRLLKEMQRRRTHLAIVVDEFGGTSGLVTLEDVLEEIVGEIQDEADVEAAPVKVLGPFSWLADASVPLHDLETFLNQRSSGQSRDDSPEEKDEIHFPSGGDYETLGGFVTATAGRVPAVGAIVTWGPLTLTVRGGDERKLTRVEISRGDGAAVAQAAPAVRAS